MIKNTFEYPFVTDEMIEGLNLLGKHQYTRTLFMLFLEKTLNFSRKSGFSRTFEKNLK
jgi:hypothetical protein